jgi:hypothetical protein
MGYSGARGTLIYEKNLKAKILCQTPFKKTITASSITLQHMVNAWVTENVTIRNIKLPFI